MDDVGIELGAGVPANLLECVVDGKGRLIAAVRGDGVEGVGDREDSGEQRNVFAFAAVRVAESVEALVMAEHRLGDLGVDESVDHAEAEFGVAPNLFPLFAFEGTRLEKHRLVDLDLADVVELAGDPEATEAFLAEVEALADGGCQVGYPGTVGKEPWILVQPANQSIQHSRPPPACGLPDQRNNGLVIRTRKWDPRPILEQRKSLEGTCF